MSTLDIYTLSSIIVTSKQMKIFYYKNNELNEIIKPYKKIAIRILCAEIKKELILLHAFDKPRYYKANDKKIKSQITKNYNIALNYYNELKKYENHKEEYK